MTTKAYTAAADQTTNKYETRKGGNYSDVLPLKEVKAARRDSICGFKSELQTNP